MRNWIVLLTTISLTVMSCHNADEGENELVFEGCKEENLVTQNTALNGLLIGTWNLTDAGCGFCDPKMNWDWVKEKRIEISFLEEGTFSVKEDEVEVDKGTWSVNENNAWNLISLEAETYTYLSEISKSAFICDGWLVSDGTALDGYGYYYRKLY